VEALHLTDVALSSDRNNSAALNARLKALELLQTKCENYVEEGWLEVSIAKTKQALAAGN
jgi:hypothetical protein